MWMTLRVQGGLMIPYKTSTSMRQHFECWWYNTYWPVSSHFFSACCWLWLWYVMMVICDVYQEMDRGKLPFHSPSVFTARSSESKRDLRRIEGMYRKVIKCCWCCCCCCCCCCWWWWWWRRWWRWWCWAELEGGEDFGLDISLEVLLWANSVFDVKIWFPFQVLLDWVLFEILISKAWILKCIPS